MELGGGKYVRYSAEQVDALEKVYSICPKPTSLRRHQLLLDSPFLSSIHPKQIKVWFQNRRCREKQRKESSRLQNVNKKLSAINKLLMEENDRLQRHLSHLLYQNGYMRHQLHSNTAATMADTSSGSAMSPRNQKNRRIQHPQWDADDPERLMAIAEETAAEFMSKATGTAINWVQLIGMKPGPDSIGIVAVSPNCSGVAARACGLVSINPLKVVNVLKDRISWFRECRCYDVLSVIPLGNGGTVELVYMQMYAPTTLASPRDFWLLRYTIGLDDGGLVVCERSVTSAPMGHTGLSSGNFVRADMYPSGFLVRPCEGGGSILHIVDHTDLDAWSVPEVLRPLYDSSAILAQRATLAALRHIRQLSREASGEITYGGGRQPTILRAFTQRLSRGFNEAVNGFPDEGWASVGSDGSDDVNVMVNTSSRSFRNPDHTAFPTPCRGGILCAKASMLLQNVPSGMLIQFLREHRPEWADYSVEAYSAACLLKPSPVVPCVRPGGIPSTQAILPLAHTLELEEFLEVIRLEGQPFFHGDCTPARDMFLLQLCSGVEENTAGGCAQLVFAPIDESFADDAVLIPSGFRVIPLDPRPGGAASSSRTHDLTTSLEPGAAASSGKPEPEGHGRRSVLTIAFQFMFDDGFRDEVTTMARQYVRAVVGSVQRVAMAIAPSRLDHCSGPKPVPGSPEATTLAQWIFKSYMMHTGVELFREESPSSTGGLLKQLWHHFDAVMCCTLKNNAAPVFSFANQAGLDLLEITPAALHDLTLDMVLDECGRKVLCSEFSRIMQQGFANLPPGGAVSSTGRPVSYEQAVVWTVVDDAGLVHCLAFLFVNWTFL